MLRTTFRLFSSLYLTVFNLFGCILLVFFGTLEQTKTGVFIAQEKYFYTWFVFTSIKSWQIPLFPGGYTFALLLSLNLLAALTRFRYNRRSFGILLIHCGLIFLIIGEVLTSLLSQESQMLLRPFQPTNYSTAYKNTELVLIDTTEPDYDQVLSIPTRHLKKRHALPQTPLTLRILHSFPNSSLKEEQDGQISVTPLPPTNKDNQRNCFTTHVAIEDEKGLCIEEFLLSNAISRPQELHYRGRNYELQIREQRFYHPFSIELQEFIHEKYPGTNIPKHFCSHVKVYDQEGLLNRQASISMNQPLHLQGKTFYQASFADENRLSVLQVVDNPGKSLPYISSSLVALGLALQFTFSLQRPKRKK